MRYAVILAGGVGTRLWPLSRINRPKQLIPIISEGQQRRSLLELAVRRLDGFIDLPHTFICTRRAQHDTVLRQAPGIDDANIIDEPASRDTAPAIALAAAILHQRDPKAILAVLAADHRIHPVETFHARLDLAFRLVQQDPHRLVTFYIEPTSASTSFGYIERAAAIPDTDNLAWRIARFHEKPDEARAQAYIDSGAFGWNAGMFVWSASTFLDCVRRYQPELHEGACEIAAAWDTPGRAAALRNIYPTLPRISVDYAILERAAREQERIRNRPDGNNGIKICTVKLDVDWLDVGSWPSYEQTLDPDEQGNRTVGPVTSLNCRNVTVFNDDPSHHVAVLGCEDLIVVRCGDATLVMSRARANELKSLNTLLPDDLR